MSTDRFLSGVRALVVEAGLGKGRARILCRRLEEKGGEALSSVSPAATHILVGKNVSRSRLPSLLGQRQVPGGARVLRADWLSCCLARGERVSEREHELPPETSSSDETEAPPTTGSPTKTGGTERVGGGGGEGQEIQNEATVTEGETTEEEAERPNLPVLPERVSAGGHAHQPLTSSTPHSSPPPPGGGAQTTPVPARTNFHLRTQTATTLTLGRRRRERADWQKWTSVHYLLPPRERCGDRVSGVQHCLSDSLSCYIEEVAL